MRVHSIICHHFFLLSLLLAVISSCNADQDKTFEVVGTAECTDCKENNFNTIKSFSGLNVTIDCKLKNGEIKRIGADQLDKEGKFIISIPRDELYSLKINECHAQLHSAAALPCPSHDGLEGSKIVFHSQINGKYTFGPSKNLQFSTELCTSKFLWPHHKYPSIPKIHKWKKNFPKVSFPPLKSFPKVSFPPLYKPKPINPTVPIYKPKPTPVYKPKPISPTVPIYKPKPKPLPIYKAPKKPIFPPPVPIYKKPPVITKPLPPFYKKPFPSVPKLPPFSKNIPPKYFHHPKFGYFPPLPPSISHP